VVAELAAPAAQLDVPAVAPVGPHRRLAEELESIGFDPTVAEIVSRAVVNPSDAKRRIATPDTQRTSTADVQTIGVRLWVPLLLAHVDNKRETAHRSLPMTGTMLRFPPLPLVTSEGCEPWLSLEALSAEQLTYALQKAEEWLIDDNPLWEQIGEEGVLRPHTAIATDVDLAEENRRMVIVGSADGSSRTASAHRNLGLKVRDVITFLNDDRAFRRFVGNLRARAEAEDITEAEKRAIRSLTVPADLIIRVVPRRGMTTTTARAVRTVVGLMHVQPPKEWKDESKFDAQGEEILEELASDGTISEMERAYLAGQITLPEAAHYGLPRHADERAGLVVQTFRDNDGAAKRAIKRVTHQVRLRKRPIINVAAELAMRSYRDPIDGDLQTSRVGLQLAWLLSDAWEGTWSLTRRSPEQIRDAALSELGQEGGLGSNQIELAVLGSFELTRVRVLTQYSLTKGNRDENLSSPAAILRLMATTPLGIHTLYQALAEGRRGATKFLRVSEDGRIAYTSEGETEQMTARWLRQTFRPDATGPAPTPPTETPETEYRARQEQIAATVHSVRAQLTALSLVKDETGAELVRTRGWRPEHAAPLVRELNATMQRIQQYIAAYRIANNIAFGPEEDLALTDESDEDSLE
jgi:hypothetical protein